MKGFFSDFFRREDWTKTIVGKFDTMVGLAEENFRLCVDRLVASSDVHSIRDELYARDREINAMERDIRRRIITHLAASPSEHEIPLAFVLTSVVKDVERLGDYVKNLYEVHDVYGSSFDRSLYDPYYDGVRTAIKGLFVDVRKAFRDTDEATAHASIESARELMVRCDQTIHQIANEGKHTVQEAVALVLVARHYKRILAHLVNISTAVVMPADKLDYYDEPDAEAASS